MAWTQEWQESLEWRNWHWWEFVLEGETFATLEDIQREVGPEYAMWLEALDDRG